MGFAAHPDAYVAAIQATYGDLERWQARARTIEPPQVGSELAGDDQVLARNPISEVARASLISAGEHLRLARDAIEVGQWYPSAHFTVLRGALVGACQGVWILGPEQRSRRRERGLTVLAEMHTKLGAYYQRLQRSDLSANERLVLGEQITWLAHKVGTAAGLVDTPSVGRGPAGRMSLCPRSSRLSSSATSCGSPAEAI